MKLSLIDTDILSEFFKENKKVKEKFELYLKEFGQINMSVITYYEIKNGLIYKDAKKQLKRFEDFAELNNVISFTVSMADQAAKIQASLRNSGLEIGHTDTLIAGTALTSGFQLVTNNTKHFKRIPNLKLENWIK